MLQQGAKQHSPESGVLPDHVVEQTRVQPPAGELVVQRPQHVALRVLQGRDARLPRYLRRLPSTLMSSSSCSDMRELMRERAVQQLSLS